MVQTIKFSQFANNDLTSDTNTFVGLSDGVNAKQTYPIRWTTAARPSPAFNGLMGYNTDLDLYEYWNESLAAWVQFMFNHSDINWSTITAVSVNAQVDSGYVTNRSSTPVSVVLPAIFNPGDIIEVMGLGLGGWSVVANAGQTIKFGSVSTATAGAINSDIQYANITLRGLVENTTWSVISVNSNPTYV
jgi:hypothetical protein